MSRLSPDFSLPRSLPAFLRRWVGPITLMLVIALLLIFYQGPDPLSAENSVPSHLVLLMVFAATADLQLVVTGVAAGPVGRIASTALFGAGLVVIDSSGMLQDIATNWGVMALALASLVCATTLIVTGALLALAFKASVERVGGASSRIQSLPANPLRIALGDGGRRRLGHNLTSALAATAGRRFLQRSRTGAPGYAITATGIQVVVVMVVAGALSGLLLAQVSIFNNLANGSWFSIFWVAAALVVLGSACIVHRSRISDTLRLSLHSVRGVLALSTVIALVLGMMYTNWIAGPPQQWMESTMVERAAQVVFDLGCLALALLGARLVDATVRREPVSQFSAPALCSLALLFLPHAIERIAISRFDWDAQVELQGFYRTEFGAFQTYDLWTLFLAAVFLALAVAVLSGWGRARAVTFREWAGTGCALALVTLTHWYTLSSSLLDTWTSFSFILTLAISAHMLTALGGYYEHGASPLSLRTVRGRLAEGWRLTGYLAAGTALIIIASNAFERWQNPGWETGVYGTPLILAVACTVLTASAASGVYLWLGSRYRSGIASNA